jgi:hypothetical protein
MENEKLVELTICPKKALREQHNGNVEGKMETAHSLHVAHLLGFFFFCPSIGTASTEQSYDHLGSTFVSLLNSKRWNSTA